MTDDVDRVRRLNDELRTTESGGVIGFSGGILAKGPEFVSQVRAALRQHKDFSDDPIDQHDMATMTVSGERVIWFIEAWSRDLRDRASNPADSANTCRLLTVMLADEADGLHPNSDEPKPGKIAQLWRWLRTNLRFRATGSS